MEFNGFIFNENGVCTNPNQTVLIDSKRDRLIIVTAQHHLGWCAGFRAEVSRSSEESAHGQWRSANTFGYWYSSEQAAIDSQIKMVKNIFGGAFEKAIKEFEAPKTMQLF